MTSEVERRKGLWATTAAFAFWGAVPIYWKSVGTVSAHEMIALRVLWALPFAAILLWLLRGWGDVRRALASRRTFSALLLTAALIGVNWFVFIEAVARGKVLQTSLGYFINPLINIVLGFVFLGERLRTVQWVAVALAALGVANQIVGVGEFPWIALVLALSFGTYGLLRKTMPVAALPGLFVEALVIAPLAVAYMVFVLVRDDSTFTAASSTTQWLVPVAGLITVMPLVWFSYGARRIPLSTVGLLQFLAPTGHFLLATLLYDEPFTSSHVVTFVLIWSGLALYRGDLRRSQRAPAAAPI